MTNCYFENSADHSYTYSYDNYGNRVEKKTYGNNAVLERYTWTRGRLLERIANASNATIGQYTYDLNGVRYTKTAGGVTTTYFYDGNTLTGENRSDGKRLRYFYDTTGLCGFSYFNGSNTKYYTYVKDVLGNIVMIKDHLGLLMTKYTYDEWGNCTVNNLVSTIGNVNPFRYRGYYFDTESGLYYLMSRYYDPEIGQFISMDTSDYLDPETIGGVDLYAYGLNNPVMYYDPSGHVVISVGAVLFAAAIGFGVGFGISKITQQSFNNGEWDWKIATVDGLFSAASAALTMIPGIGPGLMGVLNFGLTMANMYITTGMENNWEYTTIDHFVILGASVFSGALGYVTRRNFLAESGEKILRESHKLSKTLFSRIFSDYYYQHAFGDVSLKSAKDHLLKTLISLNFGEDFWIEWVLMWAQSLLSSFYTRLLQELT